MKSDKNVRKRKAIVGIDIISQIPKKKQTKLKVIMESLWDPFTKMRVKKIDMAKIKCANSLFLFGKRHLIREICFRLANSKYFGIALSLNLLADVFLTGLSTFKGLSFDLAYFRSINTLFFTFEASIKIIVHGCALAEGTYMRDIFNIINTAKILGYIIEMLSNNHFVIVGLK